jgi:hypothetical protein
VKRPSLRVLALCPRLKEPALGPGLGAADDKQLRRWAGPQDLLIAAMGRVCG